MIYILLLLLTFLSCFIFDRIRMPATVSTLVASYRQQMEIMKSRALDDEAKQKALLKQIPIQLKYLLKLILGIILFISPFILLLLVDTYITELNAEVVYSLKGILVSLLAVIIYIAIKKKYGALFKS